MYILINALMSCCHENTCFILIDEYFSNKCFIGKYVQIELLIIPF